MRSFPIRLRAALPAVLLLILLAVPAGAVEIKRVVSPGGIEAWLVEDRKNPIVTLYAEFPGGQAADPVGKEGLANMTAALLDEGAGPLDSAAFQKELEDRSISLSFAASTDGFSVSLQSLTEESGEAFRLLRLALTEPRFEADAVERMRGQILSGIRRERNDPKTLAGRAWWRAAFPDHPYGRSRSGTEDSVAALTPEDFRAFVARTLVRRGLVIGAVGDIAPERLAKLLDETFGGLPAASTQPVIAAVDPAAVGETMVIEVPVPQSVVTFGHKGIRRDDPDWYAATILMEIMAGGFGSRLTEEIREKRGLTYGISAYLLPLDASQLLMGGVATRNDKVAETVRLVKEIWTRMGAEGPTEEEARNAKTYINGSFPMRFTSSAPIARTLAAVQRDKLGIDYLDKRSALIDSVTMADLKRVAKRLFRAEDLTFSIAGKPQGITPTRPAPETRS